MDFLKTLGIEKENQGVSTGLNWMGEAEGSITRVVSPVAVWSWNAMLATVCPWHRESSLIFSVLVLF